VGRITPPACFACDVVDSAAHGRFVELTRARLAAGAGYDDVLGELRQHDLSKIDSIRAIHDATGMARLVRTRTD